MDFDPPAMILGVEREEEDGLFIISSYSYSCRFILLER